MINRFTKPEIVVSKCIEFDFCRYNSQIKRSDFVESLKPFVNFKPICPEYEIGLGIPREPVRIILKNKERRLVQPATGLDLTDKMNDFIDNYLKKLDSVDGFILKSKSPSCGIKDVKIYPTQEKSAPIERSSGFFNNSIIQKYPNIAIEDELRLQNSIIREHFLRKIFTYSRFRNIKKNISINDLIKFQTENKLLLVSYNQKEQRIMGNIIAENKKKPFQEILQNYQEHLDKAFSKPPRCTSNINVLQHAFGYLSNNLNSDEKKLFLDSIKNFRLGRISITVPASLIYSWIIRFNIEYLKNQTFFNPYPEELMSVEATDVCSSRDYWK